MDERLQGANLKIPGELPLRKRSGSSLSFYDYLHLAIAKGLGIPLITRDRDLMDFAKNHVKVFKPEDLLR